LTPFHRKDPDWEEAQEMPSITVWVSRNALPKTILAKLKGLEGVEVREAPPDDPSLEAILSGQDLDVSILQAGGNPDPRRACLCGKNRDVKVLLTGRCPKDRVREYLKSGIQGYIGADAPFSLLVKAIRAVHAGEIWADRDTISSIFNEIASSRPERDPPDVFSRLSAREKEVLELLCRGYENREISEALFICEKTVKAHSSSIFRKPGVRNRLQAALLARQKGFPPDASPQISEERKK